MQDLQAAWEACAGQPPVSNTAPHAQARLEVVRPARFRKWDIAVFGRVPEATASLQAVRARHGVAERAPILRMVTRAANGARSSGRSDGATFSPLCGMHQPAASKSMSGASPTATKVKESEVIAAAKTMVLTSEQSR